MAEKIANLTTSAQRDSPFAASGFLGESQNPVQRAHGFLR